MTDRFNWIETRLLADFQADASIAAEVNYFHEKLREEFNNYPDHQLPALAIQSVDYVPSEEAHPLGELTVIVEVITKSGDLAAADAKCKEIVSLVIDRMFELVDAGGTLATEVQGLRLIRANVSPANINNQFFVFGTIEIGCLTFETIGYSG